VRFFFYGTLLDDPLRDAVIGRRISLVPATLRGWHRFARRGVPWPSIAPMPSASVDGGLAGGISDEERRRLDAYEGASFAVIEVEPVLEDGTDVPALMFVQAVAEPVTALTWRLDEWQRRHRAVTLRALGGDGDPG
jgi:hypothetical protein